MFWNIPPLHPPTYCIHILYTNTPLTCNGSRTPLPTLPTPPMLLLALIYNFTTHPRLKVQPHSDAKAALVLLTPISLTCIHVQSVEKVKQYKKKRQTEMYCRLFQCLCQNIRYDSYIYLYSNCENILSAFKLYFLIFVLITHRRKCCVVCSSENVGLLGIFSFLFFVLYINYSQMQIQ